MRCLFVFIVNQSLCLSNQSSDLKADLAGLQTWKGSMAAETCLIWSEPGGKIARISAKRRGAATEVDEHGRVHGGFPRVPVAN